MHAATQFSLSTVTMSAKSVGGSTPGVRVTWRLGSVEVEYSLLAQCMQEHSQQVTTSNQHCNEKAT